MPYVMLSVDDWMFLRQALHRKQTVRARLSVGSRYLPGQKIANIIAQRGETPSLIIAAHYDSFFNTVGAHDNASGIAALLCAASASRASSTSKRAPSPSPKNCAASSTESRSRCRARSAWRSIR